MQFDEFFDKKCQNSNFSIFFVIFKHCSYFQKKDDARKLLVNSIAQNIFESLKKNADLKNVLSSLFQNDSTLADSLQENLHLRGKTTHPNLGQKQT